MMRLVACSVAVCSLAAFAQQAPELRLNDREYFEMPGANVMVFQDIYPDGHQGGVNLIQHGVRVASNGDLRLGPTPGQWAPIPKQTKRVVNREGNEITAWMAYPDESKNRKGFNPIDYPDLKLTYKVRVHGEGGSVRVTVDLDQPLPAEWVGKAGFNFELYPGALFGKSWYLGDRSGIFPRQPDGPDQRDVSGEIQPVALATGKRLSLAPEADLQRLSIESHTGDLVLLDARNKHNNGWFVVRSLVPAGATTGAIEWVITPHVVPGWKSQPVVHVSQIGYHPKQSKVAIVELDASETAAATLRVKRISEQGGFEEVLSGQPAPWGKFLRYAYFKFDFSSVTRPGMYVVEYGGFRSEPFQISADVFKRHVWQPTVEYFLPAQMCHMRVEEQYKVWHGLCHMDDARMAPVNLNHFDGYLQGPSTLTKYNSGETIPGLNAGGWHDAGDDDFRIESQADEVSILASAYELFGVDYDDTTIDQAKHLVRIHQPDGKPDLLQQVEHGVLTILGGYKSMGRFYRGIITPTLEQYVILGDTANVTDNLFYDPKLKPGEKTGTHSALSDDRWVFTEENASHEYKGIAALAIAGRVMKTYNPGLAQECVDAAEKLWQVDRVSKRGFAERMAAAAQLWSTTRKPVYGQVLLDNRKEIVEKIDSTGWAIAPVIGMIQDASFVAEIRSAVKASFARVSERQSKESPFGVPYRPYIWGAGWDIQRFGVQQYYLHHAFPEAVTSEYMLNALNFVLGVHPGSNTASFASGVGSRSMTVAYGFNRADWTYIPGGVTSGTALIRPDFPELKDFPYLWQQGEYVLGGGATNFMFLVLAADQVLSE
jgi:endoglucanase